MSDSELRELIHFVIAVTKGTGLEWRVDMVGDAVIVGEIDQVASLRAGSVRTNEKFRLSGDISLADAKAKVTEKLSGKS